MGFWGMSQAGREAESWPREYGAYSKDQFKNWQKRSDDRYAKGEAQTDWASNYMENLANQGLGTPEQMTEYGRRIMPGVDQYISNRKAGVQDMMDRFGGVPTWQDTMRRIDAANEANRAANQQNLSYIDQTRNYALGDIGDTYARGAGREADTYGKNTADITGRYDRAIGDVDTAYGGLRQQNRDVYGRLGGSAEDTYRSAAANLDLLRPGSEAATARTARAFAPQIAATSGRLRRAGIDPSSPQAAALMGRAETARSRAMDDAMATGNERYAALSNELLGQRQAARERLGTGELGTEIGLGTDQNRLRTGLSLEQGQGLRGENVRSTGAQNELDRYRSGQAINTQNLAMDRITQNQGREMDINAQDARNAQLQKAMATGDWETVNNLTREMNAAELEGIGLQKDLYNTGLGYRSADLGVRTPAATQVGNYGQYQQNYGLQGSQAANQWGNTGQSAYQTAYGYEAPNAGWGMKMLGGLAGAGLNMVAPGAGSIFTGATGGAGGGGGGWGSLLNAGKQWITGGAGAPSAATGWGTGGGPQMAGLPQQNRNIFW